MEIKCGNVKLTALMVFYNENPSFVKIQIESILNQTYRHFKFIIVSDNPNNIVLNNLASNYAEKDHRITFIVNEKNLGIPKAKNVGLKFCNSEFIAISDADDYCYPERFEKQVAYLESHPDVAVVGSYALIMDEKERIIGEMHTSSDDKYLKTMMPFEQPIYHPSMTYRRVINGRPVRYNEEMKISLDYELCLQFSDHIMANIPEYLINYRHSSHQTTQIHKEKYIIYDAPVRKRALCKYYNGITDKDFNAFVKMYYKTKVGKKGIEEVGTFIKNFYLNNLSNKKVYLKPALCFILLKYLKFLFANGSFLYSLSRFLKINNFLGNKYYVYMFTYAFNKYFQNVKYKLYRKSWNSK